MLGTSDPSYFIVSITPINHQIDLFIILFLKASLLSLEYSHLFVSTRNWFQDPLFLPKSTDAQVRYINGVVFAPNIYTSSHIL